MQKTAEQNIKTEKKNPKKEKILNNSKFYLDESCVQYKPGYLFDDSVDSTVLS